MTSRRLFTATHSEVSVRRAIRTPVLLTWEDIASQAGQLPPDERDLLGEVIAARQMPHSDRQISDGGWRLAELNVQGHIGIGESPLSIHLPPGNGVTIVSARNGVGKTSVADAARHLLSGGQQRSYELEVNNVHSSNTSLSITITNGHRQVRLSCGPDRQVRWHESGRAEDGVPAQWSAAFERYRPVLLYPEISPIIEEPGELHTFLKGALELTALDDLRRALDDIRADGRQAARRVEQAHRAASERLADLADGELSSHVTELGQTPAAEDATALATLLTDEAGAEPEHVPLPDVWQVDESAESRMTGAIARVRSAREGVLDGAKTVRVALESLLSEDGSYVANLKQRDVCPTCQTQGAGWVTTAAAEAARLRDLLAGQARAEQQLQEEVENLRSSLPPRVPPGTRTVLAALSPDAADLMARWDALAHEAADLTVDTALTADFEGMLAGSAEVASWFTTVRARIMRNRSDLTASRAVARQSLQDWLETLAEERAALSRQAVADRLVKKVEDWIKHARSEIFQPISKRITEIWSALNVDGDLDVTGIALSGGVRQQQKVTMELAAAGFPLPAQVSKPAAVLSTGQRNALSLATYLPRATQDGSPFRFLVLDDPVHAFDEWRVRYLAQQLASLGEHYQIVVFTHDNRLWRELRALGANPTHLRLDRPPGGASRVRVRDVTRPSQQLLDEAMRGLKHETDTPLGTPQARTAMILALCRQAVDTEVAIQLEVLGRRLEVADEQIRADLGGVRKTRDQLDLLNVYLTRAGLRPIGVAPYQSLISALNASAHGRVATSAGLGRCREWVHQTRQLTKQIHAVTG